MDIKELTVRLNNVFIYMKSRKKRAQFGFVFPFLHTSDQMYACQAST